MFNSKVVVVQSMTFRRITLVLLLALFCTQPKADRASFAERAPDPPTQKARTNIFSSFLPAKMLTQVNRRVAPGQTHRYDPGILIDLRRPSLP